MFAQNFTSVSQPICEASECSQLLVIKINDSEPLQMESEVSQPLHRADKINQLDKDYETNQSFEGGARVHQSLSRENLCDQSLDISKELCQLQRANEELDQSLFSYSYIQPFIPTIHATEVSFIVVLVVLVVLVVPTSCTY